MGLSGNSASVDSGLLGIAGLIARSRDAYRALRGKRPKYSALARQIVDEQLAVRINAAQQIRGIGSEADIRLGALGADESAMFDELVAGARAVSGPIIQFGTLLGETISAVGAAKAPHQKVIAVDLPDSVPWKLPATTYCELVGRVLNYAITSGEVEHHATSTQEFLESQVGVRPALVFLNFVTDYEEARQIIQWAQAAGAHTIAGRGYDFENMGLVQAVDECGGPEAMEGSLWKLSRSTTQPSDTVHTSQATGGDEKWIQGLVSIVIPAFNARDFIGAALEDVSRQLYRRWELVVVEDGSVHDVESLVAEFQAKHPHHRVVYRRKPANTGVSNSRNQAMDLCRGEFVSFLDADDRWAPDHLQRKVRLLHQTCCDLVYSRVDTFDSATGQRMGPWGPTEEELKQFPGSLFGRPYLQPSGVVVRQSLLKDTGHFDETLAFAEDYDYWFRAVAAGKRFCFDEKTTSRYRKNHASAATTDRLVLCYDGVARVSHRHLSRVGGDDPARRRIVAKHYFAAGTGHLAHPPTPRNGCRPETAPQLLRQAWKLGDHRRRLVYYLLAHVAVATRTTRFFRAIFKRAYDSCLA